MGGEAGGDWEGGGSHSLRMIIMPYDICISVQCCMQVISGPANGIVTKTIRNFLVHSDTENRPIEFPVSHLLHNVDQSGYNPIYYWLAATAQFSPNVYTKLCQ